MQEVLTVTSTMLLLATGSKGSRLPSSIPQDQTVVKAVKSTLVHELHSVVLPARLTKGLLQKIIHQRKVLVTKHSYSLNQR